LSVTFPFTINCALRLKERLINNVTDIGVSNFGNDIRVCMISI
jgi:hypothetical protein